MVKIVETTSEGSTAVPLDELLRESARRMLVEALEVEVSEYVERHRGERGDVTGEHGGLPAHASQAAGPERRPGPVERPAYSLSGSLGRRRFRQLSG